MISKLLMKCGMVNFSKVPSCDCFRRRLRIINGENEFYEVMARYERRFRFFEVNDRFSIIDYKL